MIIKMSDGSFYELTSKEYTEFLAEMMLHLSEEKRLTVNFVKDTRVEAAKLLLDTVASNKDMSQSTKEDYFKIALNLVDQYNNESGNKEPKTEIAGSS